MINSESKSIDPRFVVAAKPPQSGQFPRWYWLYQIAVGILLIVLIKLLGGVAGEFHPFQRQEYHIAMWAIGANLFITALISHYTRRAGWVNRLSTILVADSLLSVLPLGLALLAHYALKPHTVHSYGLLVGIFLFGKCTLCTYYACMNADVQERDARLRWFLFGTSVAILGAFAPWYTLATIPQGDESHYMLLTYSLIHDHDFFVQNNYDNRDFVEQFPPPMPGLNRTFPYASQERIWMDGVAQEPHLVTNPRGEKLLWHDVGIPVLLIPGYAIGKRLGAELTLALFAATLPVAVLEIAVLLGASIVPAIVTAMFFTFTPPLFCYSQTVFPEIFGAVGILWLAAFFLRYREQVRDSQVLSAGIVTALMPWICIRFWVLAGPLFLIFAAYVVRRHWKSWGLIIKNLALLGVPSLLGLAMFAWFDHKYFGMYLPNAGYHLLQKQMPQFFARPDIAVLGMFFDRAYGLLPTAPFYVAAAAGIVVVIARRKLWAAAALLAPCAAYVAFLSFSQFWAGGWTPPARYISSGVALLVPAAALVINRRSRSFLALLGIWTLLIDLIYTLDPFNRWPSVFHIYVYSALMEYFHDRVRIPGLYSMFSVYPVMREPRAQDYLIGCGWIVIYAVVLVWLVRSARNTRVTSQEQ